ncbi:MAG: type II toxin-antitoxin system VapC family toxin [Terriglobia bacterium]
MKDFVLDASVALGWLIDDPSSGYAGHVQEMMEEGARAVVPVHWHLEMANALLSAGRRKILRRPIADVINDIAALTRFLETDDLPDDIGTLVHTGERHQLTAYDAAYITLAARRNLPIATQDAAMLAAAHRLKIPTVR